MVLSERRLFAAEHILGGSGANWTDMPSGEKMNDLSFLLVELTTFCDVDEDCCCCCCSIVVDASILGMNPISKKDKWHTRYESKEAFSLALLRVIFTKQICNFGALQTHGCHFSKDISD